MPLDFPSQEFLIASHASPCPLAMHLPNFSLGTTGGGQEIYLYFTIPYGPHWCGEARIARSSGMCVTVVPPMICCPDVLDPGDSLEN